MEVKIFTVTKNETDLLEDFVQYHGSIFGFSNVILIDNDSDCKVVLELYRKFRCMGVVVEKHSSYRGQSQGEAFTKYMSKYRHQCKFMVGLDTDEFIQFPGFMAKNLSSSLENLRNGFRAYFSGLRGDASKFNVVTYFNSVPDPSDISYKNQKVSRPARDIVHFSQAPAKPKKCFFRSKTFLSTGNGCHKGKVSKGVEVTSKLCYVHFHSTGARRSVERARSIVSGYGYADVDSPLESQLTQLASVSSPIGSHRVLEYALFLSRLLTLNLLVRLGAWPTSPSHLEALSLNFPFLHGISKEELEGLIKPPPDWENKFDDMILYDEPLPDNATRSVAIRTLLTPADTSPAVTRPAVALMLSGHLRNFKKREKFWKNFVEEFPDVDIFVHTWTDGGNRGAKEWIDVGKNTPNHHAAKSILKPVCMMVENHEALFDKLSFREPGVDLYYTSFSKVQTTEDFTKCIGSQLYSVKKCFELTQNHLRNTNSKPYDVYVRLRGDSIVDNFGNLMSGHVKEYLTDDMLVINGSDNHVHPGGGRGCRMCDLEYISSQKRHHRAHSNDVCDIFYFGTFAVMSRVCNMYDHVKGLVREFQAKNKESAQNAAVKKHLQKFKNVTTVSSPHVYENIIKCFYPERLIREFMQDHWLVSDVLGLVPTICY